MTAHQATTTATRFPLDPLLNHLRVEKDETGGHHTNGRSLRWFKAWAGFSGDVFTAAHRYGLSERQADRLACKAGLHPLILWPERWMESINEGDDE